ncbi:hypothetical protein AWJ20_4786 [Sugiyamaella lignohabitans]|uniref:Alpha-1,6-mannanase n=1 Tax=Sugiyamaella lignohabitans TaxID=796027 RepID=A0A167EAJ1_9ASCO|nr:uncharacterized protein AWJ20_4786 [Sugiyamaella lignohabitans]ANB13839.1 hypothetical protein AWJ20_4786 [Sugiyamaella lignohabitans]
MTVDLNLEGYNVVRQLWLMFYDKDQHNFICHNNSGGPYCKEGRYTLWPVAVTVQAIVDAMRIFPKEIGPMMRPAFEAFDAYYSPKHHAYCASFNYDGNNDVYYDDNAQVASCFLSAYEVTHDKYYLDKAVENVHFLMTGAEKGIYGGVRWHMGKQGSNTCTTAEVGIACMRLARVVQNNQVYIDFAKMCADWIFERVQADDKLIADGLEPDGDHFRLNDAKWTYNQGTPITLCSLLYNAIRDEKYYKYAEGLALAATDHNTAIFDRDTQNMDARYYRDTTYFYQLLAEGLADFLLFFSDKAPQNVLDQIRGELLHTIDYVYKYIRDDQDGLYFQLFSIYEIDQKRADLFRELTGETGKPYKPHEGEREKTDAPVDQRKLVKGLMGCGAAARVLFQTARVHPTIDPK